MNGPEHFAPIAWQLIKDLKPTEYPMPQQHDHYAELITNHGKDNDYEQLALDALVAADNAADDSDRATAVASAVALATLHLARQITAVAP